MISEYFLWTHHVQLTSRTFFLDEIIIDVNIAEITFYTLYKFNLTLKVIKNWIPIYCRL